MKKIILFLVVIILIPVLIVKIDYNKVLLKNSNFGYVENKIIKVKEHSTGNIIEVPIEEYVLGVLNSKGVYYDLSKELSSRNFGVRNDDEVITKVINSDYSNRIGTYNALDEAGELEEETDETSLLSKATGKSFGGILAEVSNRKYDEFDDGDIFYLDGIEDPFNLGYALRTLYAFGIKNVLLSNRDYTYMESQLLKSSAGAYDMLNIKIADDAINQIKGYKEAGYYLYGLYRGDNSKDIFDVKFNQKALFMLGGEKRGISSEILALCNEYLYISYGSDFRNSLNACGALDVVATLLYSQRKKWLLL